MPKRKSYRVYYGSWHYDTPATSATEAKRNAAHVYRNRMGYWKRTIDSIMNKMKAVRLE